MKHPKKGFTIVCNKINGKIPSKAKEYYNPHLKRRNTKLVE